MEGLGWGYIKIAPERSCFIFRVKAKFSLNKNDQTEGKRTALNWLRCGLSTMKSVASYRSFSDKRKR